MTGETANGESRSSETTRIPSGYKAIVHGLSLLLPAMAFALCFGMEAFRREGVVLPVVMAAMMLLWTCALYWIAGGFDWKPGSIGVFGAVLYALLGGVLFAIPLFVLWLLIRIICAAAFRLPIAAAAGKIWVSGERTAT